MIKSYYRFLQKRKLKKSIALGLPFVPMRRLDKRKYLTMNGFKNHSELTLRDKLSLNVIIE